MYIKILKLTGGGIVGDSFNDSVRTLICQGSTELNIRNTVKYIDMSNSYKCHFQIFIRDPLSSFQYTFN